MQSNKTILDQVKVLATTALEETWGDDQEIVFLAEWCTQYNFKERWSSKSFELLEYHWRDRSKLNKDHAYLEVLYENLLKSVAEYLNNFHNTSYPLLFWRILVGPWLIAYLPILWDRWESIRVASENNQDFVSYIFEDLDRSPPSDGMDSNDMTLKSDKWNHVVFKEILLFNQYPNISLISIQCPKSLRLSSEFLPMSTSVDISKNTFDSPLQLKSQVSSTPFLQPIFNFLRKSQSVLQNLIASLRRLVILSLKHSYNQFSSLFKGIDRNLLLYHTYFPRLFLLKMSFILKILPPPVKIFEQKIDYPEIKNRNNVLSNFKYSTNFEEFLSLQIFKDMPIAYLEGFNKISAIVEHLPSSKIIFTANAHFHNEVFKLWTAKNIVLKKSKLFISSHGGAFYPLFSVFNHQELIAEKRIIWGQSWTENQLTLPPNKLHFKVKKYLKNGHLSLMCYDFWRYGHRIGSFPMGPCLLDYFELNRKLIHALNPELQKSLKIRPAYVGEWHTHQRYYDEFGPEMLADRISLFDQMKASRLIICTYPQTTLSEAMFSGVPTMLFYSKSLFETQPIYVDLIKLMKNAKIIHTDPDSAAAHIYEIYNDPMEWWNSNATVQARRMFENMCMTPSKSPFNEWSTFFNDQISQLTE